MHVSVHITTGTKKMGVTVPDGLQGRTGKDKMVFMTQWVINTMLGRPEVNHRLKVILQDKLT
jgi:hypothetical protein